MDQKALVSPQTVIHQPTFDGLNVFQSQCQQIVEREDMKIGLWWVGMHVFRAESSTAGPHDLYQCGISATPNHVPPPREPQCLGSLFTLRPRFGPHTPYSPVSLFPASHRGGGSLQRATSLKSLFFLFFLPPVYLLRVQGKGNAGVKRSSFFPCLQTAQSKGQTQDANTWVMFVRHQTDNFFLCKMLLKHFMLHVPMNMALVSPSTPGGAWFLYFLTRWQTYVYQAIPTCKNMIILVFGKIIIFYRCANAVCRLIPWHC